MFLHYGDMTDSASITSVINKIKPHEIYNLAAQFMSESALSNLNILLTLMVWELCVF